MTQFSSIMTSSWRGTPSYNSPHYFPQEIFERNLWPFFAFLVYEHQFYVFKKKVSQKKMTNSELFMETSFFQIIFFRSIKKHLKYEQIA